MVLTASMPKSPSAGKEHFYLETHCAIAWLDESEGVTLQCSTQHPSETQDIVARVLGIRRAPRGGQSASAWAARSAARRSAVQPLRGNRRTRRVEGGDPVLVRLPRALDMVLTGKHHPFLARFEAGYDDDGPHPLASTSGCIGDGGWSLDLSDSIPAVAHYSTSTTPYLLPAVTATGLRVPHQQDLADRIPRLWRSAGRTWWSRNCSTASHGTLSLPPEDGAAPQLLSRRRQHALRDGSEGRRPHRSASGTNCRETGDFAARRAGDRSDYNAAHPYRKRGLAITS